jgi:hypothetical protein
MPTAGDRIIYHPKNDEKTLDLVYLGGRWAYKSYTIDRYLLPVLKLPIKYKLYGWGEWPPGICSGILPEDQAVKFLSSGKIGPCVSERHTHQYGIDIPERAFKLALCGTLVIHDPVPRLNTIFPDIVMTKDPQDYSERCLHFIQQDDERKQLAEKQRQFVLNNHTYHHRLSSLFRAVGFHDEAVQMLA